MRSPARLVAGKPSKIVAVLVVTFTLVACSVGSEDPSGESSSAETTAPKCSSDWIRDRCQVITPYVKAKGLTPLSGTTAPPGTGPTCDEFSCSDFGSNFCRCAENLCPGITGKMLYQQIVLCTNYYTCDIIKVNHVVEVACDAVPGDPTKKDCKCIEPNQWGGEYNIVYGGGQLGIDDDPPPEWCQTVTCNKFLGTAPKGWHGCPGGSTKTTCDNVNGRDKCPADCCVNTDGTVPAWCNECKVSALATCGKPPDAMALQCVTCSAPGDAPRCQGTKLDGTGKTVPNGNNEPCAALDFLVGGKCPAAGTGWSDAKAPGACDARDPALTTRPEMEPSTIIAR